MESKMILSELVTDNIRKETQVKFISEQGLLAEYSHDGRNFNVFVQDSVNEEKMDRGTLENFLFEELFYGYQRETYIYRVATYNENILTASEFFPKIRESYDYVNSNIFNFITCIIGDIEEKDLVAMKVIYSRDTSKVAKVRMIFGKKVSVVSKGELTKTISYIPIEWDIAEKIIIIKVAPKRNLFDKSMTPENLNKYYLNKIIYIFDIDIAPFDSIHKEAICEMSKALYQQLYNKMVRTKPLGIDEFVDKMSIQLTEKLNIEGLQLKATVNNIFNIKDILTKQVENILISDILFDVENGDDLEGVKGVVTYLKFNDGKRISARLRGQKCREPIFDSESYMSLRSAIECAQRTSRLGIVWLEKFDRLRVAYDATDLGCLNIHFYRNLCKEEFEYGLQMYWKYERRSGTEDIELLSMEARAQ